MKKLTPLQESGLRKILSAVKRRYMAEELTPTHQVEYYATVGEHGGTGRNFYDFKSAVRSAKSEASDSEFMDGLEYLGVAPYGMNTEFAVVFCTPKYIKRISQQWFDSPSDYQAFKAACEKYVATKKLQIGKFA